MRADLPGRPSRHQLAWLSPSWATHLAAPVSPEARAALGDWFARGHPAVVCRPERGAPAGVPLCVTLPASRWNAAIRFTVGRPAITRLAEPPPLREVVLSAPPEMRAPLAVLDRDATAVGVPLSVVGALAWQHHTGLDYVTPRSPVELHFRPRTRRELEGILGVLRIRENWDGPPLAGEVILGWNDAVAWRDLARGRRRVLVQGPESESVVDVERLLVGLR
jgi:phosphoribosyl-dephospho-CoA transferase